jgi:hypothetical protein
MLTFPSRCRDRIVDREVMRSELREARRSAVGQPARARARV